MAELTLRQKLVRTFLVLMVVIWSGFPIFLVVLSSFKDVRDIFAVPPAFIFTPTLDNYRRLAQLWPEFFANMKNSLIITVGATLVTITLPRTELSIPVYYVIAPAEASSNLSRFDGVKFGHRAAQHGDLTDMYKKTRAEGFGDEVKRRIMIGAYVLSHGYYDAYYLQAQKIRRMIADDFQQAFAQCDVIAGPVAPTVAWKLGEKSDDPVANYLADIFTLPASLAGLPGLSLPVGFGAAGMPVGMQLIGNYLQEARLLNVAHRYQQATDWHTRQPGGQ